MEITQETQNRLNQLTEEFKPTDCSVILNPDSIASLEEIAALYSKAIEGLKEFSDSGYDPEVGERFGLKVVNRGIYGEVVDTAK